MGRKKRRKTANARKKNQNPVEGSGISMEIQQPENIAVTIPQKQSDVASIELAIKIKSFINTTFLFRDDAYLIEIIRDDEVFESEIEINRTIQNNIANWRLLKSGFKGEINLDFAAEVYWEDNLLDLKFSTLVLSYEKYIVSASCNFKGLKPGTYQLRFIYHNQNLNCNPPSYIYEDYRIINSQEPLEIFRDKLATKFIHINLLQPIEFKSDSIEVNDIIFRNLIPYTEISLKRIWSSFAKFHLGGIQIFNKTDKAYYFSVYYTIEPQIISGDGEIIASKYLGNDWSGQERMSDVYLSKPGKNTFLFPDTCLCKAGNQFFDLVFYANYGGGWCYQSLELNKTYRISFTYTNNNYSNKRLGIGTEDKNENLFWTGKLTTPFVEFKLVI